GMFSTAEPSLPAHAPEPAAPDRGGRVTESGRPMAAAPAHAGEPTSMQGLESAANPARSAVVRDDPAIVLTRAEFDAAYRAAFATAAGRAPTAERVDIAWERAQQMVAMVADGLGLGDGRDAAENSRKAEIRERDDIMTFLDDPERARDLVALRHDPEALRRLFAHRVTGPQLDGPIRLARSERLADGTVLAFGPGIHRVSWAALEGEGGDTPRDITIRGAGMDRTLIALSDFSTPGILYNLHLRGCTIDCGNNGAFDLREAKASLFAEDVRFVRFDAGHGGCYVVAANEGGAFYAVRCVFAGGYGRSPGNGHIDRFLQLVRFEDCTFERLGYPVTRRHGNVAFDGCLFRDCPEDIEDIENERDPATAWGIGWRSCRTEWTIPHGGEDQEPDLARALTELFPDWK
ncbi:MAG: hypothetical protein KDC98_07390, partial [Planctomycetes bacterium]|nr:hypothetical protein [Planctomycetota bacterium]